MRSDDFELTGEHTVTREYQSQTFDAEEMQAIREQYEERLQAEIARREAEVARREELEWQVRMMLAQVRDAEQDALRAADQMHKIHATLQSLLGQKAEAPVAVAPSPPRPAPVLGVAPVIPAKISPVAPGVGSARATTPPPIPLAAKNSRGPLPPRPLNGYRRTA
jgi:outer membrane protein TolC